MNAESDAEEEVVETEKVATDAEREVTRRAEHREISILAFVAGMVVAVVVLRLAVNRMMLVLVLVLVVLSAIGEILLRKLEIGVVLLLPGILQQPEKSIRGKMEFPIMYIVMNE